jgi:hypothetical protein
MTHVLYGGDFYKKIVIMTRRDKITGTYELHEASHFFYAHMAIIFLEILPLNFSIHSLRREIIH